MKIQQSQVSPQLMSMTLLPGEEKIVDVEVFAPTKGPLDLYILMDFSNSMIDDLNNLKRMGKELGEHIWICCMLWRLFCSFFFFQFTDPRCLFCSCAGGETVRRLHHWLWEVCGQSDWAPDWHETIKVKEKQNIKHKLWKKFRHVTSSIDWYFSFSDLRDRGPTVTLLSPSKTSSSWPKTWTSLPVSFRRRGSLETWTLLREALMPSCRLQCVRLVRLRFSEIWFPNYDSFIYSNEIFSTKHWLHFLFAFLSQDKIGWRQHSTHLLVFSTESAFHYETDGANVLSGILPRNDELCHLDADGKYTKDTKQDYPSIPTLVRILRKHNIIPIFAVTNHSYTHYKVC